MSTTIAEYAGSKRPFDGSPVLSSNKKERREAKRWSATEDGLLLAAIKDIGPRNWKVIAGRVPGRNHAQCLQRFVKALQPGLKKGYWTREEDVRLTDLVQRTWNGVLHKGASWAQIATEIPGRTSKQCRERWFHHLDPAINRSPYTPEDDRLIMSMWEIVGNKWADIARMLNARTSESVKTRFQTLTRRQREGGVVPRRHTPVVPAFTETLNQSVHVNRIHRLTRKFKTAARVVGRMMVIFKASRVFLSLFTSDGIGTEVLALESNICYLTDSSIHTESAAKSASHGYESKPKAKLRPLDSLDLLICDLDDKDLGFLDIDSELALVDL